MHSLNPYLLKCYDQLLPKNAHGHQHAILSAIRGRDLLSIVNDFINTAVGRYVKVEDEKSKRVYCFSDVTYDPARREIYGFMKSGLYGVGTDIIDVENGNVVFRKGVGNADLIRYYFHFVIPPDFDEGICLLSSFRGDGIKTLFFSEFDKFFKRIFPLNLSASPLSYDSALAEWQEGFAKEIRVTRFNAVPNIEDVELNGGHLEGEFTLKPRRRSHMGRLADFFVRDTEQGQLVAMLEQMGGEVKTLVQLGDRKRTFRVGVQNNNVVCQIDFPDEIELQDGMLILDPTNRWASGIVSEFCAKIYPGVEGVYREREN